MDEGPVEADDHHTNKSMQGGILHCPPNLVSLTETLRGKRPQSETCSDHVDGRGMLSWSDQYMVT